MCARPSVWLAVLGTRPPPFPRSASCSLPNIPCSLPQINRLPPPGSPFLPPTPLRPSRTRLLPCQGSNLRTCSTTTTRTRPTRTGPRTVSSLREDRPSDPRRDTTHTVVSLIPTIASIEKGRKDEGRARRRRLCPSPTPSLLPSRRADRPRLAPPFLLLFQVVLLPRPTPRATTTPSRTLRRTLEEATTRRHRRARTLRGVSRATSPAGRPHRPSQSRREDTRGTMSPT